MKRGFLRRLQRKASVVSESVRFPAGFLVLYTFHLLCILPHVAPAATEPDFQVLRGRDADIVYEASLRGVADQVLAAYPVAESEVENTLGWHLKRRPSLILVADRARFDRMSGSDLIAAFAVPREQTIVMHITASAMQPYAMQDILKHELCHLVLHDHIRGGSLPRWLDEGIAQWVSGSLGELMAGMRSGPVSRLDLSRNPIPLAQLAASFPGSEHALLLAYEESLGITDFIVASYGREGLLTILRRLEAGDGIEVAVRKATGASLGEVEAHWREGLGGVGAVLVWVGQYLYEILFFLAAVLAIAAFVRLSILRRRYTGDDESESE